MNSDEFEKRLQQQAFRKTPENWRQEILSVAKAKSLQQSYSKTEPTSGWRELLWPCPQAWAGLAAVWLVILTMNFATQEPETEMAKTTSSEPEAIAALKEQRRLYLELAELHPKEPDQPPKQSAPRPRSDRRKEFQIV